MSALYCVNGTVCDAQQDEQSFAIDTNSTILTNGQSIGLALTAEASFLSFGALTVIFILIARNLLRYRRSLPNGDWKLLRTPADIYMLSLFSYDLVQAVGGILNVRWADDGIVTMGSYCTAQGIMKQMGELGVALLTLILTIHTFTTALWSVGAEARSFAFGVVTFTCLFVVLWVGISNGVHKDFETPTPFWCWIGPKYNGERLAGEYVWMWIALFASVVMYVPVHFWMKGHLSVDGEKWYKFPHKISSYPLAYSVMVIPLSVSRWLLFNHKNVPSATTFFGIIMFHLSGATNVLLFLIVRPRLLLFTPPDELGESSVELAHTSTSSAIFPDMIEHDQSLPTRPGFMDDV
ncbi:hypothetical protein EDB92DRAFT_1805358 [Lactarius akahatsu]|uniref:Glucose receptor Git3 N-terminal domain-containing protein n=1 Tax=Lactarius akahatsu TaxID=416441 RepID=A0AAD4L9X2_9AGAM|nr:hypothetical protein EDB92DRAFT_1807994 [Lactarius akahatsu]KAH8981136.1 hypothetical protein EDB92DRAFT_1805358 [Lactarius akahatsu]